MKLVVKAPLFAFFYTFFGTLYGTGMLFFGFKFINFDNLEIFNTVILFVISIIYMWSTTRFLNNWLSLIIVPCVYILCSILLGSLFNIVFPSEGRTEFYSSTIMLFIVLNFYSVIIGTFFGLIIPRLRRMNIKS